MAHEPPLPGLEVLLDRTRAALLSGDLMEVARLAPMIEAGLLAPLRDDPVALGRLRASAERNAALLSAAMKGVTSARRRMAEVAQGPRLSTYDASGRLGRIGADPAPGTRRI